MKCMLCCTPSLWVAGRTSPVLLHYRIVETEKKAKKENGGRKEKMKGSKGEKERVRGSKKAKGKKEKRKK